jgi:5-methyltetrahydropteroyltriglutamate--homocysteine methyltransferase
MSMRAKPPYRADHVGSLLRPERLLSARRACEEGRMSADALRKIEDECIRDAIKQQEDIGLSAVTDGEFRRFMFHIDFLERVGGIRKKPAPFKVKFQGGDAEGDDYTPAIFVVEEQVRHVQDIFVDDFRFVIQNTRQTAKITIPSPTFVYARAGRDGISRTAYPDLERLFDDVATVYRAEIAALAAAGCTYLQMDETNFPMLCDPQIASSFKQRGDDPDKLQALFARLINDSIRDRPAGMSVALHLCRGNYRSGWMAAGGYDPVAELMFNQLGVDGFLLEYDDERSGGFAPLRFVPKGKVVVLGLVSSKSGKMESPDELARRIEEAARVVPLDQLALSPQCGFASSVHGNKLSQSDQWKKLGLVVAVAEQVWGRAH